MTDDHEQIVIRQDRKTGMRLIVAVHSTVLGPALGGLRLQRYPGGLREALEDVMGLARTMTLKASAAGLDLGGGKAVMIDDGDPSLRLARMESAARAIESLGGAYITAEDIGTTTADMDHMSRFTRFWSGRSAANGGRRRPFPGHRRDRAAGHAARSRGRSWAPTAGRPPCRRDRPRQGRRRAGRNAQRGGRARDRVRPGRRALRALRRRRTE